MDKFEKILEANKTGWFVGDKPTIADLRVYQLELWITSGILDGIPADMINNYPLLAAHKAKVEAVPQVVAWKAKYGPKYSNFDYDPKVM